MRRLTNNATYEVETDRARYAVTLERLKNTVNGQARYHANLIVLSVKGEKHSPGYFYTTTYNFTGHYMAELDECKELVSYYEKELKKNGIY